MLPASPSVISDHKIWPCTRIAGVPALIHLPAPCAGIDLRNDQCEAMQKELADLAKPRQEDLYITLGTLAGKMIEDIKQVEEKDKKTKKKKKRCK